MQPETTYPAPPFDHELAALLASGQLPCTVDVDTMISMRADPAQGSAMADELAQARDLVRRDRTIPGLGSDPDITVSVFAPRTGAAGGPGFYYAHGGGMVMGDRFGGLNRILDWVQHFGGVAVSVEYRLAPEHPAPAAVHDCYAGMTWMAAHAEELGFDPARLIVTGLSAGGGIVAGATLMARDHGGPPLAAQVLVSPMLDDRNETISSHQVQGIGVWDRSSNLAGWDALLGERRDTDHVDGYAAPARATDLSGLPPTFIDAGSVEVFRDESVAYASAIWAAGGAADLHVWAGGFHAFDGLAAGTDIGASAWATRTEFIRRVLNSL